MKVAGMKWPVTAAILSSGVSSLAQFYPDSSANWCLHRSQSPDGENYVMHMLSDPDTLINGQVYKRIDEYLLPGAGFGPWFQRYYVRSSPDGKGYMYVPPLDAEFLTGDLNAIVADTLHDILVVDETGSCSNVIYSWNYPFALIDLVLDSIDTITSGGVTVLRYEVHPLCPGAGETLFWQANMGTEHGPLLALTIGLAHVDLWFASVGDTCYYNAFTLPIGQPGGSECCIVIEDAIGESPDSQMPMNAYPDPSSGVFELTGLQPDQIRIFDAQGRLLMTTNQCRIDLSKQPQGVYWADISAQQRRLQIPLVVVR